MGTLTFKRSVSYSLLIHIGMLAVTLFLLKNKQTTVRENTNIIVEVINTTKTKQNMQVVQTESSDVTKKEAKEAFLGEKTQTVDEQTMSMPRAGQNQARAQTKVKNKNLPKSLNLSQLGVALNRPQNLKESDTEKEDPNAITSQAIGEYVKGFKEGEKTVLNTKEFVFYSYFQRIRQKLDRAWDKSLREKLTRYFYRGRQLANDADYVTQLLVTISGDGQVVKVQVLGESGTKDLDEAAVKAFNDAGPFPNPPQGLVQSGSIQVRWDFILKT